MGSLSKKMDYLQTQHQHPPRPHRWEWGGLEAVQQGLTRCSFDQSPRCLIPGNICNPLHYRGPKFQLGNVYYAALDGMDLCQFLHGRFLNATASVMLTLICFTKGLKRESFRTAFKSLISFELFFAAAYTVMAEQSK